MADPKEQKAETAPIAPKPAPADPKAAANVPAVPKKDAPKKEPKLGPDGKPLPEEQKAEGSETPADNKAKEYLQNPEVPVATQQTSLSGDWKELAAALELKAFNMTKALLDRNDKSPSTPDEAGEKPAAKDTKKDPSAILKSASEQPQQGNPPNTLSINVPAGSTVNINVTLASKDPAPTIKDPSIIDAEFEEVEVEPDKYDAMGAEADAGETFHQSPATKPKQQLAIAPPKPAATAPSAPKAGMGA